MDGLVKYFKLTLTIAILREGVVVSLVVIKVDVCVINVECYLHNVYTMYGVS